MKRINIVFTLLLSFCCLVGCSGGDGSSTSSFPDPALKEKGKDLVLERTKDGFPHHRNAGTYQIFLTDDSARYLNGQHYDRERVLNSLVTGIDEFNSYSSNIKFKLNYKDDSFEAYGVHQAVLESNVIPLNIVFALKEQFVVTNEVIKDGLITSSKIDLDLGIDNRWLTTIPSEEIDKPTNIRGFTYIQISLLKTLGYKTETEGYRHRTIMCREYYEVRRLTKDYDAWSIAMYNYQFANGPKVDAYIPRPYLIRTPVGEKILLIDPNDDNYRIYNGIDVEVESHIYFESGEDPVHALEVSLDSSSKEYARMRGGTDKFRNYIDFKVSGTYNVSIHKLTYVVHLELV